MVNTVLASYIVSDFLFLATGVLLIVLSVVWNNELSQPATKESVGRMLLLANCPIAVVILNGALVVFAFCVSIPAFALPKSRNWLKAHSWLAIIALVLTLGLGLHEWVQTLAMRAHLEDIWGRQSNQTQSMLQQKFTCCGYQNSTFPHYVKDSVCPSDIVAASRDGCVSGFSDYSEKWLNYIFTAAFAIVGMDVVLLLCSSMLIKYRKEQLRYRLIDQKWGTSNI